MTQTLVRLLSGAELKPAEERKLLASVDAGDLPRICEVLMNQKRKLKSELDGARAQRGELEKALGELLEPPLHPALLLRVLEDSRLDVFVAGRRQIVVAAPELAGLPLRAGDEVWLNGGLTAAVAHNDAAERTGLVGEVAEAEAGRIVVRGSGDEEIVAMCPSELAGSVKAGDRVVYTGGVPCIVERLPDRKQSRYELLQPPAVCFEDIGGNGEVLADIRRDLDLHLVHGDRVRSYKLKPLRGVTLVGVPGVGKTMIAGAIANYLARCRAETRFMNIRPGSLRASYYGQSERLIRELFAAARASPGFVVLFFDELDTFGTRGEGIGQEIDSRVMSALLSEISGLDSAGDVLCIGATNRLDLCDLGLIREGRMGDRIYRVPRPDRKATHEILARYLTGDLPYRDASDGGGAAEFVIGTAAAYLHTAEGGAGLVATATLASGEQLEIRARHVLSGALIASAVERAKHASAHRALEGGDGLEVEEVLTAFDEALTAEARKLSAAHVARQVLEIPGAEEIVRVDLPPARRMRRHRFLRAA